MLPLAGELSVIEFSLYLIFISVMMELTNYLNKIWQKVRAHHNPDL
jgi:hypothetical protein